MVTCETKSSAVAEMGDRGHNRHGPKRGGAPVPLSLGGGSDRIGQTVLQTVAQENYFKIMSAFVDVLTQISLLNFFSKLKSLVQ